MKFLFENGEKIYRIPQIQTISFLASKMPIKAANLKDDQFVDAVKPALGKITTKKN